MGKEIDEKELKDFVDDKIVEAYKMSLDDPHAYIVNPAGVKNVQDAYEIVKKSVKTGRDFCKVTCKLHDVFVNSGSVELVGKKIVIKDPEKFAEALVRANNYEVYPKTDGTVQLNLGFYGLTL